MIVSSSCVVGPMRQRLKSVKETCAAQGILTVSTVISVGEGRVNTRQLEIFPLATTTVGWVPDRTPGGPKRSGGLGAKRRVVRAGCRLTIQLKGNRSAKEQAGFSTLC